MPPGFLGNCAEHWETQMEPGTKVQITQNGQEGVITDVCRRLNGAIDYFVRYADDTGRLHGAWMAESEFTAL